MSESFRLGGSGYVLTLLSILFDEANASNDVAYVEKIQSALPRLFVGWFRLGHDNALNQRRAISGRKLIVG